MLIPHSVCLVLCEWILFFFAVDLTFSHISAQYQVGFEAVMLKILSRRD